MNVTFKKLTEPTSEILECLNRWENDPALIPLIHPMKDKDALQTRKVVTAKDLEQRLSDHEIYLIYLEDRLIGEMDYQVDPRQLYKKEPGSAWIGILIGEEIGRGKGIGYLAFQFLENEIKQKGLKRIELGVFEFNTNAIELYKKLGYQELVRLEGFTFWQDKWWQDIRLEKYI